MKTCLTAIALVFGALGPAHAGWEVVEPGTIRLSGSIDRDSYQEYLGVAGDGYSTLLLDSNGGFPSVALAIAEDVARRRVSVVVDGVCISACANYLAIAGDQLAVECGSFLAWHGTLESPEKAETRMRAQNEPEGLIETYVNWLADLKRRERAFYEDVGIDYRLLGDSVEIVRAAGITQPPSFSFDEITGDFSVTRKAALWIPTPAVLAGYGIDPSGFCEAYSEDRIRAMLAERNLDVPFASGGTDDAE